MAHTSLKFSPINPRLVAVTSAANFGVVGKGIAQIKSMEPGGQLKTVSAIEEKDAIFDVSWNEFNEQVLLAGCGNGLVILWNLQKGKQWQLETKN